MSEHRVTIIMPTMATSERARSLRRAIASVTSDQETPAIPLVVVNGTRFDRDVLDSLKADRSIHCFYLEVGDLPGAINFGRSQVDTEFFGFLDDDDRYYPWAIGERLEAMDKDSSADVVVSWGEKETPTGAERTPAAELFCCDDPLRGVLYANWLASCGGLYRSDSVPVSYFDPTVRYLEWTYLAFRLALDRSVRFLASERPHFFIANTLGSASKSLDYAFGVLAALRRMTDFDMPPDVRRLLAIKTATNLQILAYRMSCQGDLAAAWRLHFESLAYPAGLKYLARTPRLVARSLYNRLFTAGRK